MKKKNKNGLEMGRILAMYCECTEGGKDLQRSGKSWIIYTKKQY